MKISSRLMASAALSIIALGSLSVSALAQATGVLVIAENETPENLDPANAINSTVDQLLIGVYDTLVQFTAGEIEVSPQIAESWEISEDGRTYTFTLRQGVLFHDGSELTADDVVFTLDRLVAANAGVLNNMGTYTSAEALDDYTVALTLQEPFGPFLSALSRIYIVNAEQVEPHMGEDNARQWLAVNTAGSGPYTVTEYAPTEVVTLEAFPDYWGGWEGNHVAEVVFRYVSEPSTQLALLQSGEIHIAPDLTIEDKLALQDQPGFIVDAGAAATPLMAYFNTASEGPTGDPEFRAMLAQTFDRQLHLDQVLMGFGTLPDSPIPPDWVGHLEGVEPPYDLEAARAMVEENGWQGTSLTIRYLPAFPEEQAVVEQLQSNLAQIGIDLVAEGMTWPAQAATTASIETTADINLSYSFPNFPDPHAILNTAFNSALTGVNGGLNWAQYENPEVDALLNQAATSSNAEERAELYRQVQQLVAADHPTITTSLPSSVVALSQSVQGYVYNAAHHQTFNYMDIGLN